MVFHCVRLRGHHCQIRYLESCSYVCRSAVIPFRSTNELVLLHQNAKTSSEQEVVLGSTDDVCCYLLPEPLRYLPVVIVVKGQTCVGRVFCIAYMRICYYQTCVRKIAVWCGDGCRPDRMTNRVRGGQTQQQARRMVCCVQPNNGDGRT